MAISLAVKQKFSGSRFTVVVVPRDVSYFLRGIKSALPGINLIKRGEEKSFLSNRGSVESGRSSPRNDNYKRKHCRFYSSHYCYFVASGVG
ncbi:MULTISPECIES: hypothetical protein [Candidatus Ichthyocystis]|uniref:hypothetical protein n=1 Tax=Candidatus Ichthyocystis TaxID=2929841 RepID=UPI000B86B872|nr:MULTISPECIES: hypothetical protein [Ichthyocystis]